MESRLFVLLAALAGTVVIAGCAGGLAHNTPSETTTEFGTNESSTTTHTASAKPVVHKKGAVTSKRSKALNAKLRAYEQSPEYKKIQTELRQGREYERTHKAEEEAREHEYERRARGELTPEEQERFEKDQQESQQEEEAIKEGERIREREEGKVP